MVRIALLSVLLIALLTPSLRSDAAGQVAIALRPGPDYPLAAGTAVAVGQGTGTLLTVDLHGLPADVARRCVVSVTTVDHERYDVGTLAIDREGNAAGDLGPLAVAPGGLAVGVAIDAPGAPGAVRRTLVLVGQLPEAPSGVSDHLAATLGPDWLAPILPASLGFLLLRHAGRLRRVERRRAAPPARA